MHRAFVLFVAAHIALHGVLLVSVFDVYFKSPLARKVLPLNWTSSPSARRLVLFVADGLRADKFFELTENGDSRAPFLRDIILHNGTWGVSHTRAPTESRPAHVAMLGGFFEDPSALKVGWKDNPVEFDTVLNESRETWAWGADDVLPFFNKGTAESRVHLFPHHYRSRGRLADLDVWVFNEVKEFLKKAKFDGALRSRLLKDKIIFFLHLAGIDSNGHAFHPASKMYLDNICVVDDGIKEIVAAFNQFYADDGKTAFLFTGDHGMTDHGGHGGSHPTEVRTPFVAWGSGVKGPAPSNEVAPSASQDKIDETTKWGLDPRRRIDVSQIDISILMASLIGVPYPVNSLGSLPLQYIAGDDQSTAKKALGRARQMAEAFLVKRSSAIEKEFHFLPSEYQRNEVAIVQDTILDIVQHINLGQFKQAMEKSLEISEFTLKGLQHYQAFHRPPIRVCVVLTLIGWIILAMSFAADESPRTHYSGVLSTKTVFKGGVVAFTVCVALFLRLGWFDLPPSYYLYVGAPVAVWFVVFTQIQRVHHAFMLVKKTEPLVIIVVAGVCAVWVKTLIAGVHQRHVFAVAAALLGTAFATVVTSRLKRITWAVLCACVAVFPMLPEVVKGKMDRRLVLLGGVAATFVCAALTVYHGGLKCKAGRLSHFLSILTVCLPAFTGLLVGYSASYSTFHIGELILVLGWIVPFFTSTSLFDRLTTVAAWQLSAYIVVSQSYDALFYVTFTALLHVWVVCEADNSAQSETLASSLDGDATQSKRRALSTNDQAGLPHFGRHDVRRSCVLLFLLLIGFFGIFSVESMNHFRPRTLPFLPVTDSFTLLVLFVYKLCLHYLAIGVALSSVIEVTHSSLQTSWCVIAALSDFMFLHFYFWVKDSGSWAEIGFSLANLLIVTGLPIGLLVVLLMGKFLTSVKVPEFLRLS